MGQNQSFGGRKGQDDRGQGDGEKVYLIIFWLI